MFDHHHHFALCLYVIIVQCTLYMEGLQRIEIIIMIMVINVYDDHQLYNHHMFDHHHLFASCLHVIIVPRGVTENRDHHTYDDH